MIVKMIKLKGLKSPLITKRKARLNKIKYPASSKNENIESCIPLYFDAFLLVLPKYIVFLYKSPSKVLLLAKLFNRGMPRTYSTNKPTKPRKSSFA